MKLKDIMTKNPEVVQQSASVREAAQMMKKLNVGSIPVTDGTNIVGIITDRDIVLRSTAEGHDPNNTTAGDVMSKEIVFGYENQDVEEAAELMGKKQIRRLPVLDGQRQLIGIVSLGDVATEHKETKVSGEALDKISQPSKPKR